MFKNKKKIEEKINENLENKYLFGIDVNEDYIELITYDLETKNKESNFYDMVEPNFLIYLHDRRRKDIITCFNKIYNDVTINEIDKPDSACIDFIQEGNKFKVEYNVSTNLVCKKVESDFISNFINLYSLDKKVYKIDNKIIDITTNPPVIKQSNIIFLDNENYAKELHLNGDFVCANEIPGIREMKSIQEEKISDRKRI